MYIHFLLRAFKKKCAEKDKKDVDANCTAPAERKKRKWMNKITLSEKKRKREGHKMKVTDRQTDKGLTAWRSQLTERLWPTKIWEGGWGKKSTCPRNTREFRLNMSGNVVQQWLYSLNEQKAQWKCSWFAVDMQRCFYYKSCIIITTIKTVTTLRLILILLIEANNNSVNYLKKYFSSFMEIFSDFPPSHYWRSHFIVCVCVCVCVWGHTHELRLMHDHLQKTLGPTSRTLQAPSHQLKTCLF